MGIGDWGLGIGDWAQSPIPNPQSPIPNPQMLPLSAPLTTTPSLLRATELIIELCPERFLRNLPSGHCQTLILSHPPKIKFKKN
jgi:hypothetical protein